VSTKRKAPKRRDQDPVRVYADGRIAYWTGGRAGLGHRRFLRGGSLEEAIKKGAAMRGTLARTEGVGAHFDANLDQLMQDMLVHLRTHGGEEGSIRQYKTNYNTWITDEIGHLRCLDAELRHWTAIFDHLNHGKASETTVRNMSRTLGVLMEFGVEHGYFLTAEPFAEPRRRRLVVKKAKKRAAIYKAEVEQKIQLKLCPTLADVEKYAAAFEAEYPGYGYRLVMLAFATGLRLNELLALRHDSINLKTGEIAVDWQLDRYNHWPAHKLPKGRKTRTAIIWDHYLPIAESLVADSLSRDGADHGSLFPRHRSTTAWADQAGKLAGAAKAACDWNWTFHWLRHAWASLSLAPEKFGGYGLDAVSVQHWLGHERLSTTQDMYVERQTDDASIAKGRTSRAPGAAPKADSDQESGKSR
jgi:integrase